MKDTSKLPRMLMRLHCRSLRRVFIPLVALVAGPALSQNLLVNPGFDRDLSGWTAATSTSPDPAPPGYVEASLGWTSSDASTSALSGGASLHARANTMSTAKAALTQCVPVSEGMLISFGAKFLTARQYTTAQAAATVSFFSSADCSGMPSGSATAPSLPTVIPPAETTSGGLWLSAASQALSSAGARSVLFEVGVNATGTRFYGLSYVDAVADDAVLTTAIAPLTTSLLPSAAWVHGAGGAYWQTKLTLVNPGTADGAVTLKFLPHDVAATSHEFTYLVRAGQTLTDVETNLEANYEESFGAILMTSSSPSVFLQSETSTFLAGGGTVGQAVPALGPADFAGASPKTLAPIRESASFRTNLVLANATEAPLVAHVAVFDADGTLFGSRNVDLPPLGMTQINHVAAALGTATLDLGRISISTPTPGGLVAAYASVIDNTTNDPRTLLPQDGPDGAPGANLLLNPGFDRDLAGWTLMFDPWASSPHTFSADWTASDASGSAASGGLALHAFADIHDDVDVFRFQCLPRVSGNVATFGAKFLTARQSINAGTGISVYFFSSTDCSHYWESIGGGTATSLVSPTSGETSSDGAWLPVTSSIAIPSGARSMGVYVRAWAYGFYNRISPLPPPTTGYVDAVADDIFATVGPAAITRWILPSAAWIHSSGGTSWATHFTLCNPGVHDAVVTLKWLGHDADGRNGREFTYSVRAGQTLSVLEEEWATNFAETWGAVLVTSSSPVLFQSETSAPASGGSVGQALSAMSEADFVKGWPVKNLAPIRENASFRTNLVLANTTEAPLTAHVALFAADGTLIGTRDVDLPPLGMTQLTRAATLLGATTLDLGRIAVSTQTPGGLLAAYASVIDNRTNDPRTLLPR